MEGVHDGWGSQEGASTRGTDGESPGEEGDIRASVRWKAPWHTSMNGTKRSCAWQACPCACIQEAVELRYRPPTGYSRVHCAPEGGLSYMSLKPLSGTECLPPAAET